MGSLLVTGGAGFIGSHLVESLVHQGHQVVVLDLFTYAGQHRHLSGLEGKFQLFKGDIADANLVRRILNDFKVNAVFNLAAESHVDRSIQEASSFIQTNIVGTYVLLDEAQKYWRQLPREEQDAFRFIQVSTDEVFGSLGPVGAFNESSQIQPSSPYAASKASADLLTRAWHRTYGLPIIITNCSNNYGPRQHQEKLIPHMISCALNDLPLPVYGNGSNRRDWIHVLDHCKGLILAWRKGVPGSRYCFGGGAERSNLEIIELICKILDKQAPNKNRAHAAAIQFVQDRPGHDQRYAIDDRFARAELGYAPGHDNFEQGLQQTVDWYLNKGADSISRQSMKAISQ